jgi:membrane-associated progesterone receptor component
MSTLREFTREEIREYDGKEGRPIYICIANKVFDCSEAANFYGPGGSYEAFAGRDITRAAAKFSTEERYLASPSLVGLTLSELDSFKHFHNVFNGKYPIVGKLRKDLFVGSAPVSAEAGSRATVAGATKLD